MRNYLKNKYLTKAISMLIILSFCFLQAHCYAEEFTNLKTSKIDTLSPAISISKDTLVFQFSHSMHLKRLKLEIMSEFPSLKKEFDNIKETSYRWKHTLEVVLYFDRLKNKDFGFFMRSYKERRKKLNETNEWNEDEYRKKLEELCKLYEELSLSLEQEKELDRAIKLHDIGFTQTKKDYDHPEKGAKKAKELLKELSPKISMFDFIKSIKRLFFLDFPLNISKLIKHHDLIGNIIRGKKVVTPLVKRKLNDKFVKMLTIINAMDIAGYGNENKQGEFVTRNNLTPIVLKNLLAHSDKADLKKRYANNEFYLLRLYMLGRGENNSDMFNEETNKKAKKNKKVIQNKMEKLSKTSNDTFETFQANWTNYIEVDDVSLFYKLTRIDSSYELLAKLFWGISDITSQTSKNNLPLVIFTDFNKKDLKNQNNEETLKQIFKTYKPGDFFGLPITKDKNRVTINLSNTIYIVSSI